MKITILLVLTTLGSQAQRLSLSTKSDSALFYYFEGWQQVMDYGNYTAAENSYRKMISLDADFLIGWSLVGRISTDPVERKRIESLLTSRKNEVKGDERLLLDVFIELLELTNLRETNPGQANERRQKVMTLGEKNLRVISHRYPDDIYYIDEYLEVIHYNHGAMQAIDSLRKWQSEREELNMSMFLSGFEALLWAELGKSAIAIMKWNALQAYSHGYSHGLPTPKTVMIQAEIFYMKEDYDKAANCVESVLKMDPKNVDALRLKAKLKNKL